MSTQQPSEPKSDPQVLVSPVYLAGRGNQADISNALYAHRDWGWAITDHGQLFTSPRHDIHVACLPESRDGGWKITRYNVPLGMPVWSAGFSRNTPAEITAAFTAALGHAQRDGQLPALPADPQDRSWHPAGVLADRGWSLDENALFLYLHAPDEHACFSVRKRDLDDEAELRGEGPALWTMYACVDEVNGERWHADFTSRTPLHLLTETARAFSSTEPVERPRSGIPERNLPYVTTSPSARKASEQRQSAALARTRHTHPAAPAPPTGTTAPDPTSPAPFRRR